MKRVFALKKRGFKSLTKNELKTIIKKFNAKRDSDFVWKINKCSTIQAILDEFVWSRTISLNINVSEDGHRKRVKISINYNYTFNYVHQL